MQKPANETTRDAKVAAVYAIAANMIVVVFGLVTRNDGEEV